MEALSSVTTLTRVIFSAHNTTGPCSPDQEKRMEVGSWSIKSKKAHSSEAPSGQQEVNTQHVKQGFGALWGRGTGAGSPHPEPPVPAEKASAASCLEKSLSPAGRVLGISLQLLGGEHKGPRATHCLCVVSQGREMPQQPGGQW